MDEPTTKGPVIPAPMIQIRITLLPDGAMNVNGFPTKLDLALRIMQDATIAIINHFVEGAKEGKLDKDNAFEKSRIITPDNKIPI